MTTPKLPPRHPNPAVLTERRRQAQAIADRSIALALAADYGKAMELRPDFWGRPFLDYKAGSGWDDDEPAAMTWVRFTASQALRALRGLDRLAAAPEANRRHPQSPVTSRCGRKAAGSPPPQSGSRKLPGRPGANPAGRTAAPTRFYQAGQVPAAAAARSAATNSLNTPPFLEGDLMRCFGGVAEYGLTDLDYAEFLPNKSPLPIPTTNRRRPPLPRSSKSGSATSAGESLDHDEPEAIIAGLLLAAVILLPPSG